MASEYLKKKYQDVKPDVKVELTPEQKRKNWWDYHKWHVVIGVVVLFMAGGLIWDALGIGDIRPDYRFAYIGENKLPDDTAAALETALASLGEDLNGDGRVAVELRQYPTGGTSDEAYAYAYASQVQIVADLDTRESYFFLLEDPESFQKQYEVLCYLDGTLPPEGEKDAEGMYLSWADCPVLAGLELGSYRYDTALGEVAGDSQELMRGLFVARRGFWTDKTVEYPEGAAALWETITAGAAD